MKQAYAPGALKWNARLSGARVGRYRLGPRMGVGGAASVYLARLGGPHNFERLAAVKIIHEHLTDDPEFVSMFLDEANLVVRLSHPNIVHVYELGREGEMLYLAMEYLHGRPLSDVYRALAERGGQLPHDVVAWIGARAAEGLHHAHQLTDDDGNRVGLVHRDISPENVFVTYEGHIKLIDFGIAHAVGRITTTALGHIKGKYRYMAPEQALGRKFDHRVDVFSLGVTLFEAALGAPVFDGVDEADTLAKLLTGPPPDPRDKIPGFPADLAEILLRTLAHEPGDRYADAGELARDLDAFVARSGRVDQREQLESVMGAVFAAFRESTMQAIADLRAADTARLSAGPPTSRTVSEPSPTVAPRTRRWPWAIAGGVLLLTSVGLGLAWQRASPEAPETPPSAAAHSVTLDVTPVPDVEGARITVAGVLVEGHPARRDIARSGKPVHVVVEADGFQRADVDVIPDRDRAVSIPLRKLTAPSAGASVRAPSPAASASAALPPVSTKAASPPAASPRSVSGPARPTVKPPAGKPAEAKPPAGKPPPSDIITDYPF